MKTLTAATLALSLSLPGLAFADTSEPGIEGRAVGETLFASIDTTGRGAIHMGDLELFRASVFEGMDYDENGRVTYEEFASWDPGFAYVAEDEGRAEAYVTASKIVFAFWDRDGDAAISARDMRFAMNADFRRADINDDALLTEAEFIDGFAVIVAMRAAIRPDL